MWPLYKVSKICFVDFVQRHIYFSLENKIFDKKPYNFVCTNIEKEIERGTIKITNRKRQEE